MQSLKKASAPIGEAVTTDTAGSTAAGRVAPGTRPGDSPWQANSSIELFNRIGDEATSVRNAFCRVSPLGLDAANSTAT